MIAYGEVKVAANPTLMKAANLRFRMLSGSPQWSHAIIHPTNMQDLGQAVTVDTLFTLKSVPIAIPTGTTAIQVMLEAYCRGAAFVTVDFGRAALGKISVPALA